MAWTVRGSRRVATRPTRGDKMRAGAALAPRTTTVSTTDPDSRKAMKAVATATIADPIAQKP